MNMNRLFIAVLLLLLAVLPARSRENPFWAADSGANFRILLPGGWTVRRHLSQGPALRARSRDGTAFLEVHVLREPFSTASEAAAGFEEREAFLSLSPVETWRGTIVSISGEKGHLMRYRAMSDGRHAEASVACFGRGGTWFVVLAVASPETTGIGGADLEGTLRSFTLPTASPAPGDPIEGRWRWHNGSIVTFRRDGRVVPSSLVGSWRRTPPSLQREGVSYLITLPGPAGGEEEAVLSPDGRKLFRVSGGERIQIAARLE